MKVIEESEIRRSIDWPAVIALMGDALRANASGLCRTPMPMHIDVPQESGEAHIKGSYRTGGDYFALKVATSFPNNASHGMSTGNGMMLLCSAQTGAPVALLKDGGFLTDARTAAAAAFVTRLIGRTDCVLGILGTGIQARLQAIAHSHILPLERIVIWGRTPERANACREDIAAGLRGVEVVYVSTPEAVAAECRLIVTCTSSRAPLLHRSEVQSGTHLHAVGSDSPGKQELDPELMRLASLLLVDSVGQCRRLGELQHALSEEGRVIEIGAYKESGPRDGISIADFTGLGAEDLYVAEATVRAVEEELATDARL